MLFSQGANLRGVRNSSSRGRISENSFFLSQPTKYRIFLAFSDMFYKQE